MLLRPSSGCDRDCLQDIRTPEPPSRQDRSSRLVERHSRHRVPAHHSDQPVGITRPVEGGDLGPGTATAERPEQLEARRSDRGNDLARPENPRLVVDADGDRADTRLHERSLEGLEVEVETNSERNVIADRGSTQRRLDIGDVLQQVPEIVRAEPVPEQTN